MDEKRAALDKAARDRARVKDCIERAEASAEAAYKAGASLSEIAKATGMTGEGVRRILSRREVDMRPQHVRNPR